MGWGRAVLVGALALGVSAGARAQLPGLPGAETREAAPTAAPEPEVIAVAAVPERASLAESQLEASRRVLRASGELRRIAGDLPNLLAEVARSADDDEELASRRVRRDLEERAAEWRVHADRLTAWRRTVRRRGAALEQQGLTLEALRATWEATRDALARDGDASDAATARATEVLAEIAAAERDLQASTHELIELQRALDAASTTIELHLDRLRVALAELRDERFERTAPPLWRAFAGSSYEDGRVPPLRVRARMGREGLRRVAELYGRRLPLDLLLFAVLLAASALLARRARARAAEAGEPAEGLLRRPIDGALILGLVASRFVYPGAPFAFFDVTALLSLLPLTRTLPALVPARHLLPPLYGLVALFALHRGLVLLGLPEPWRGLGLLAVGTLALADVLWALWRERRGRGDGAGRLERLVPALLRLTAVGLGAALLAGALGHASLLAYLVEGPIDAAYWMLVLLAVTRVLVVFLDAFLGSRRVSALPSVRKHGATIRQRAVGLVHALGLVVWTVTVLYAFDAYAQVGDALRAALAAEATLGSWSLSVGDILAFGVTIYLAVQLAHLVGFALEEDVLPRMSLARGVPAAVGRLTRYAIVAAGFVFAVGAAGVDMSRVALLASALSVGIGFGLQNLVNNFVSGLMLIFERPIRVGDVIEVGGLTGEVKEIGIRSSTLRTAQGAEVIVPNADLVSQRVVNWTLSDRLRRVELPVGVAYGTEPSRVLTLLQEAAEGIPGVVGSTPPIAHFVGFGESSLDFELHIWVNRFEDWLRVRSAVAVAITRKLGEAGIEIPFPQRDLHLRSVDEAAASRLGTPPT